MARPLAPLLTLLERAADAARLRPQVIEEALDLPRGGWEELLAGRRVLRVRHLLALAHLLRVPAEDLQDAGLPEAKSAARLRLADWLDRTPRFAKTAPEGDLQALIHDLVRRELGTREKPDFVPES
jgi:hypothetical protein